MQNYNPNRDVEVPQAPNDGVSCLTFSPKANFLIAGSWDNSVGFYNNKTTNASDSTIKIIIIHFPLYVFVINRYVAGRSEAPVLPPRPVSTMMHRYSALLGVGYVRNNTK